MLKSRRKRPAHPNSMDQLIKRAEEVRARLNEIVNNMRTLRRTMYGVSEREVERGESGRNRPAPKI
jgi:hypothetical protein